MSAAEVETDYEDCGTYAGWNKHRRDRTRTCAACRRAAAAYMRRYRQEKPDKYQRDLEQRYARERALSRLATLHPAQYQTLLDEETAAATKAGRTT